CFVHDQRPAVVHKWARGGEFALLQQTGEILAMRRPHLLNFGFVRRVLNGGGELHTDLTPASAVAFALAPKLACAKACAPNSTAATPKSRASVKPMNGSPAT